MNYNDLVNQDMLKREPKIGLDQVARLLRRGRKDLVTAKKLLDDDLGLAISATYDAMFHAANALIRMQGYRPGDKKQHVGVIEAVRRTLGDDAKNLILKFDDMRIARNRFEYQAIFDMSKAQLEEAIKDAEDLVKAIISYIQEKHPQKEFKF